MNDRSLAALSAAQLLEHAKLQFVDVLMLPNVEQKGVKETHYLCVFRDLGPEVRKRKVQNILNFGRELSDIEQEDLFVQNFRVLCLREVLLVDAAHVKLD